MLVWELVVDNSNNRPIVVLKETEGGRTLPLAVGLLEAPIVANVLRTTKLSRPMTHDLLRNIVDLVNIKINKIEICDLRDDTYYALIHIMHNGKELHLDARPIDALAIAMGTNSPILVEEEIIEKSKYVPLRRKPVHRSEKREQWKEMLEKYDPEDFGNYKM
jgi:bifunctional DNase/RNase